MLGSFRSNVTVGIAVLAGIAGLSYVLAASAAPPGGTTAAAVRELEDHKVRAAFLSAIEAARNRSRDLAAE